LFTGQMAHAQTELMDLLQSSADSDETNFTTATFKSTRLLNGHSIETRSAGVLEFVISHRFGRLNSGVSELYGLDQSFVRFALEYGLTDNLNIGFGRSSFDKTVDGFVKYRLIRQSDKTPFTITAFASMAIDTRTFADEAVQEEFAYRLDYTTQVLIARKFTPDFSLQLAPTLVHRNFAPGDELNDIFLLGIGGRYKFTNRLAFDWEYFPQFRNDDHDTKDALALGLEIETGGHVFQLIFSNATQMIEKGFLTETRDDFLDGDIHFGFNISRAFDLKTHK
ncbi:MAG: DUF5777 family beta-barrel protein, partial [Cyclobacteriaceae bacterium]